MKTSTAVGVIIGAVVIATGTLLLETWLLGLILPWFGVSLSFGQNFAIIALANMIFNNFGVSKK
jgi:CBS domain containing-hemolysin-like protein